MREIDILHTYNDMLVEAEDIGLEIILDVDYLKIKSATDSTYRLFDNVREAMAYVLGYLDKSCS